MEEPHEFQCAIGTSKLPNRPRPLSIAEGDLLQEDDEIEDNDKNGGSTNDLWAMCGEHVSS